MNKNEQLYYNAYIKQESKEWVKEHKNIWWLRGTER